MFRNRSWISHVATGVGVTSIVGVTSMMYCGVALCQSPGTTAQPQPTTPANAVDNNTLALPVIAEPQRIRVGDARLGTVNLFGQERDSYDQVREAEQAAAPNLPPVPGARQPEIATGAVPNPGDAELLRQAGIVLGSPNTSRLVVD